MLGFAIGGCAVLALASWIEPDAEVIRWLARVATLLILLALIAAAVAGRAA